MAIEVRDEQKKMLESIRKHLEGTEYYLRKKYPASQYYSIYKRREGFFKKYFPEDITYNLFIYDDWIFISIFESRKDEMLSLFKDFGPRIKLEIVD